MESEPLPTGAGARRLFLLRWLGLFLEPALNRYLAGDIWNLGYFPNLVLIAVFTGMGIDPPEQRLFVNGVLDDPERIAVVFMAATTAYVVALGNAVDWGENYRTRLYVEPFLTAFAALGVRQLAGPDRDRSAQGAELRNLPVGDEKAPLRPPQAPAPPHRT